jgi:serine/threonine protein kinase/tetratricopeptide (TPR) repeat protein
MSLPEETRTTDGRPPAPASIDETEAGDRTPAHEPGAGARSLERGRSLGRYVIVSRLGRGGMGVVYAAYDPELDRKIALKVLHDIDHGPAGRRRSQRLLREAQAMAQLSHPNVITVHDVGTFEGRVFFAMELVEGHTLTAWLKLRPRAWPEVVEVFTAAGRGLQAAHEAGLVHRDFKPDNVLVGADGRVRVTDFGIARPPRGSTGTRTRALTGEELEARPEPEVPPERALGAADDDDQAPPTKSLEPASLPSSVHPPSSSGRVLDMTLTRPGALAGTPAYMSPEQFGVGAFDARGDQFSFCVALWEALYGEAPFFGFTAAERAVAVSAGQLRDPPPAADVPAFVRAAVTRGLAVAPGDRHPDMAALLAVLGQRPVRRRRRWLAAGGLLAVVGATAAAVAMRGDPCASAGQEMASTWGDEARATVETAMLGTGLPYAADTWSRVRARLDAHADAWVASRVDACRAGHDGSLGEAQRARQERCLERQRAQLHALVDVLAQADPRTVERASEAVIGLPRASECADPEVLLDVPVEPEDPEALALRERYLHALALEGAGRFQEALPLAEALEPEVAAHSGDPRLLVITMALHATLLARVDPARGEAAMRRAYFEAVRRHQDREAARVATSLVFVVGYVQARTDAGLEWAAHADAAIDRGGGLLHTRIKLLKNLGDVYARNGQLEPAMAQYDLVRVRLGELEAQGETPESVAIEELFVTTSSAAVELELGQHAAARTHLEHALAVAEEHLGPRHPEVARIHNELGNAAMGQNRLDDAREHYQISLELWAASEGERAPTLVPALTNLGNVADMQGRIDEARAYYEQALALAEDLFGRDHVDVAFVLVNLGELHEHAGELALARQRYARALELRERVLGAEHPAVANPLLGLSRVELVVGDAAAAQAHAERALAVRRAGGAEDGPLVAEVLVVLGRALVRQGELAEGRAPLERVLEICETHECRPVWTGSASLGLWHALGPDAGERRAALLQRARADLGRAGTEAEPAREELRKAEAMAGP